MKIRFRTFLIGSALCGLSFSMVLPAAAETCNLSRQEAAQDMEDWFSWLGNTHPDLSWTADLEALEAGRKQALKDLSENSCSQEIWRAFAALNPLFFDAHVGLRYPEAAWTSYLEEGGTGFPIPVEVDHEGRLVALADVEEVPTGAEILSINDVTSGELLEVLTPLMRGEGEGLREFVLVSRFSAVLWAYYGWTDEWRVVFRLPNGEEQEVVVNKAAQIVVPAARPELSFQMIDKSIGLMTLSSFDIALKDQAEVFLKSSFGRMKARGAEALIIDLRQMVAAHGMSPTWLLDI